MEDHHYILSNNHIDDSMIYVEDTESAIENIASEQKDNDDYLIELYKERRYLYDHNHQDFKNKLIKENAWIEISVIMQEKNLVNCLFLTTILKREIISYLEDIP
ncbi:uncharacterized protein LOC105422137 isoform X2 [Pogonomyrmex barbatus]|uniref:Uncharacterized protein LOC105422137 isoform X2 n=1 Tax=Pogonomyrmex barbatus TaxID=144034 RepID=A0A6I9WD69_9HYME|nr:uncharacterized protein LOC105422137 isoform X2 [Pogonomyrmex barbatus]